jgi:uncharacterized protein YjbI with pentapeptide repeats
MAFTPLSQSLTKDELIREINRLFTDLYSGPDGKIGGENISENAIGEVNLVNGSITTPKLGYQSVVSATILDAEIKSAHIADAAITEAKIEDLAVTEAKIAEAAIGTANIQDASITNAKIDRATASKLQIIDADIADVSASKLTAGNIDASVINVSNLNANEITVNKINGTQISEYTITGGENGNLAEATITAANIVAETITGNEIAANTIVGSNLVAGTITSSEIAAGTITADKLTSGYGAVVSGNIAAGKLTSDGSATATDGVKTIGSPWLAFGSGAQNNNAAESAYVELDLGAVYRIAESRVYFYSGDERYYWYKLKYSQDGSTWYYAVGTADNSGWVTSVPVGTAVALNPTTNQFTTPISARYVRIYGNGNSINADNHIYEWELFSTGGTEIDGGTIRTQTINFDKFYGGQGVLGGAANGNGSLLVKNAAGGNAAILDNLGYGLHDSSGNIITRIATTTQDATITVGSGKNYATIQEAISSLPSLINHTITIDVYTGTYLEDLTVRGFIGFGSLSIQKHAGETVNVSSISAANCTIPVYVRDITFTTPVSGSRDYVVNVSASGYTYLSGLTITTSAPTKYGIYTTGGSSVIAYNCAISNKNYGVYAITNSIIGLASVTGSGNTVGIKTSGAQIFDNGSTTLTGTTPRIADSGGIVTPSGGLDFSGDDIVAPTLTSSWVNSGSPFRNAGYYKSGNRVYLQGHIRNGTVGAHAFILPAGYRPPAACQFATQSNDALAGISILPDGYVFITFGSNAGLTLEGISFRL